MYVIVYRSWNGDRAEIHYGEEEAKKRYWELDEVCGEIHLLSVDKEIPM